MGNPVHQEGPGRKRLHRGQGPQPMEGLAPPTLPLVATPSKEAFRENDSTSINLSAPSHLGALRGDDEESLVLA